MEYSDKEIVDGMLADDKQVISYFLYGACNPMLHYIIKNVFDHQLKKDELVNELYFYLRDKDWYKLQQFDYRSKLTTWLSVVATRFFIKKRAELLGKESPSTLLVEKGCDGFEQQVDRKLEIEALLNKLSNERYRCVIQELILKDRTPHDVANEMGITVDNLYNIKCRALEQLRQIIRKEGGYDR